MPTTTNGLPYPAATDTPDVPRDVLALAQKLETDLYAAWTAYTPAFGTSGTAPTWSVNPTVVGRYLKIGKTLHVRVSMTFGTLSNSPTGAWTVTLPAFNTHASGNQELVALAQDVSTGNYYRGVSIVNPSGQSINRTLFVDGVSSLAGWNQTVPFAPASGDVFLFQGSLELA